MEPIGNMMNKEDLVKKLEQAKLPELEVVGHRCRLRQMLIEGAVIVRGRDNVQVIKRPSDRLSWWAWLKGPAWRPAVASAVSLFIMAAIIAGVFYLATPSPAAIATDVVRKDPSIQQKLSGSGEIIVVRVEVMSNVARVVCGRGMGDFIEADVDITGRTVLTTRRFEGLFLAELAPEARSNALNIALLDDRIKPLISKGATVGNVFPVFSDISRITISDGHLIKITPSSYHAIVPIYLSDKVWLVEVNLDEKKIDRIIEPQLLSPYPYMNYTANYL